MTMESANRRQRRGEQGFALVLAILALMLLTFLGLTLATTTTTELQIATNYRWGQQALYNAEAGLETAKLLLAQSADVSTGWVLSLPTLRETPWKVNEGDTPTDASGLRDYEKADCDTRGAVGYGRVVDVGGVRYQGRSEVMKKTLNGAFTVWIRRPLQTTEDGQFFDLADSSKVILTVEGVAPYSAIASGAGAVFVQANQAVRVLEMPLQLAIGEEGTICRQSWGQEGMGPTGDNFDPCSPLSGASSLRSVFGAGSTLAPIDDVT